MKIKEIPNTINQYNKATRYKKNDFQNYQNSFVKNAKKELREFGTTIVFSKEHIDLIKKKINVDVVEKDFYFILKMVGEKNE